MKKNKIVTDNAFPINDEVFSDEVFINDNSEDTDEDIEKSVIGDINQSENKGQTILFAAACLMLLGIGFPVILIYYLKPTLPDQHLFILGVSYFKLVLISFLCSAIMAYSSFFFIRTRQAIIIPVFLFALFCCFPFIVGLKNELTLMETLLNQSFFSNWPFFLKPTYLFFELFIPMGIVIYLFLQLKNIIGRKKHSYAYLCIAAFLGITAFIGLSTLRQTGQPSLISFMMPRIKTMALSSAAYIKNSLPGPDLSISTGVPVQRNSTPPAIEKQPGIDIDNFQKKSEQIFEPPVFLPPEDKTEPEKLSITDPVPNESVQVSTTLEQNIENLRIQSDHILDIQKELQDLSNRLDLILKSISPDITEPIKNEIAKEKTLEKTSEPGEKEDKI